MAVETHLADPLRKRTYVTLLFDVIAPGYDAFTRAFSFGMDTSWKRTIIREALNRGKRNPVLLDLACGTGDLLSALSSATQPRLAVGLDISQQMLAAAIRRDSRHGSGLRLVAGDMTTLGIKGASVDIVTIGYGLRNAPSVTQGLQEVARVLRPGGLLLTLDFYRPTNPLWRELFLAYMGYAGRAAGWLWHREASTYGYLAPSIRRYVSIRQFNRLLEEAGFALDHVYPHLQGGICIHVATAMQTNAAAA